jgi:hypothetical protein
VGDIDHDWITSIYNWDNGKMDGFARNTFGAVGGGAPTGDFAYAYIDHRENRPYWDMAKTVHAIGSIISRYVRPELHGPSVANRRHHGYQREASRK